MSKGQSTLRILEKTNLARETDAFLIDRRACGLSPRTIDYYDEKLALFRAYLQAQGIRALESITAPVVRRFLLQFGETHNAGGVHAVYRALRALAERGEIERDPPGGQAGEAGPEKQNVPPPGGTFWSRLSVRRVSWL